MNFEQWLIANGYDSAALQKPENEKQRKHLEAAWKAETQPAPVAKDPVPTFDEEMESLRRENKRRETIRAATADACRASVNNREKIESLNAIGQQAIEDGWTIERFQLAMLREERSVGPMILTPKASEATADVLEASVCRNAGMAQLDKQFSEQTLTAAQKLYPHGMTLCDLIMSFAKRGGYTGHSVKANPEAAWKAARQAGEMQAGAWGPSTQGASIGSMLANVANKFMRVAFDAVDATWRAISATRSANDFKQITTYSLTGDLTFKKLPPGGEIKHGQVDATGYTNQLDTYARMLGLDRRDIINDDLGAFASVSRRLGRGGAIALNKLFWGVFLNNSTFFTAGRNNVSTGAGSALALAGLDTANQKFVLQTDPDGNPLGIMPRILLVPPALEVTAQTLMSSTMLVSGATTAPGTPSANIWAGKYRVASSPYMQDSTLTGNSSAAWYLLASPDDLPVVEVAFLNGVETPVVESAESDFNMLGQAFRGYFDIGVSMQEYRAGVRSAGS